MWKLKIVQTLHKIFLKQIVEKAKNWVRIVEKILKFFLLKMEQKIAEKFVKKCKNYLSKNGGKIFARTIFFTMFCKENENNICTIFFEIFSIYNL